MTAPYEFLFSTDGKSGKDKGFASNERLNQKSQATAPPLSIDTADDKFVIVHIISKLPSLQIQTTSLISDGIVLYEGERSEETLSCI